MSFTQADIPTLYTSWPQRPDSFVILAAYMMLTLVAFILARPTATRMDRRRVALLLALLVASVPLNVMAVELPILTPLLGLLPALVAGVWVGTLPAMLVGLVSGATRWLLLSGRITQPFEMALFAFGAVFLMRQNYRGWLAGVVRHPFVATLLAGLFSVLLLLIPGLYASSTGGGGLNALDITVSTWSVFALSFMIEAALNGLISQVAILSFPGLKIPPRGLETPFYARSLNRRLLWTIMPITFITITFQIIFVAATAVDLAQGQAITQLSRNSRAVVKQMDSFFVKAQALLGQFAADDRLLNDASNVRQRQLEAAINTVAFFDELILVRADGTLEAAVRVAESEIDIPTVLTQDETKLLSPVQTAGVPLRTDAHHDANDLVMISFLEPVRSEAVLNHILIGRTRFSINPDIDQVRQNLEDASDRGIGYLIDNNDRIVIHPDSSEELRPWAFNQSQPVFAQIDDGTAYLEPFRNGQRRLVFVQAVSGTPWRVVVELPYNTILATAIQISTPLVFLFIVIMVGALILLPLVGRVVTGPLGALARAAGLITQGELERVVPAMGPDEVGRLGTAFEGMRRSLKARLDDLSLLLRVSEATAASLDLERGIPPILEGARQASAQDTRATLEDDPPSGPARVARLVGVAEGGLPLWVMTSGEGPNMLTRLDSKLAETVMRDPRPLLIENVTRSRGAIDPDMVGPGLRAVIALPIRRQDSTLGVLWLGYPDPRHFAPSEVDLLVTLAGQAAVFMENARLYEAAEGGRQRLQAVLSSTSDAVLVTDRTNRILLCNPAAEIVFGIPAGGAIGQMVSAVIQDGSVVELLTVDGESPARTAEVAIPDGRTLYGSASTIVTSDGQRIGRVAVLRDITHLKELDAMKSEFVNTVSHDLRAPLTYMRGYVTMTQMMGEMGAKQKDYLDKIMTGIDQMTELIDDLLDLGRIEAGVGIAREEVSLAWVATEVVDSMRTQAREAGLKLELDVNSKRMVQGDSRLLKHAVTNYVENAIKYSPPPCTVRVRVEENDRNVVIRVSDTGIGIAPSDQAQLFEKFYRVKRRDTLDIKGTGLGLAIVKSIVEWHGGHVGVESQLGKGSTFYLEIPFDYLDK